MSNKRVSLPVQERLETRSNLFDNGVGLTGTLDAEYPSNLEDGHLHRIFRTRVYRAQVSTYPDERSDLSSQVEVNGLGALEFSRMTS
jgi:hypothetical protein